MTTQLTAVFDSRDGADLALMRLRRNGIDFSVAELRAPDRRARSDMPLMDTGGAVGLDLTEGVSPGRMYAAVLGSRAVTQRSAATAGQARLTLNIRTDQVLRAREILVSVKGRVL